MVKVLLDTNFLLAVLNYRMDIFERIKEIFLGEKVEFYFLKEALSELGNVKKFRYNTIKNWMEKRGIRIVESGIPGKLDDKMIFFAKEKKMFLATLDKRLRKISLKERIPVITISRGGKIRIIER